MKAKAKAAEPHAKAEWEAAAKKKKKDKKNKKIFYHKIKRHNKIIKYN